MTSANVHKRPATPPLDKANKVLTGTAAGIASEVGVDAVYVRVAFVLLTLAGGWGIPLYALAWMRMREGRKTGSKKATTKPNRGNKKTSRALTAGEKSVRAAGAEAIVGFTITVAGLLMIAERMPRSLGGEIIWPLTLAGIGYALLNDRRAFKSGITATLETGRSWVRVVIAVGLMFAAVALALILNFDLAQALWGSIVAILALGAIAVALTPAMGRLVDDLGVERRRRVRVEEKAKIAAHLHDSVLQTLTLIQKRSDDPTVVTLARKQERELRSWLYGAPTGDVPTLKAGLTHALGEVETLHGVAIDAVFVGDFEASDETALEQLDALQKATVQAATNAAIHSGVNKIDVYCEASKSEIEIYIRDLGKGFDLDTDTIGRAGVRESIISRMRLIGGTAHIATAKGAGTEVELRLDLDRANTQHQNDVTNTNPTSAHPDSDSTSAATGSQSTKFSDKKN